MHEDLKSCAITESRARHAPRTAIATNIPVGAITVAIGNVFLQSSHQGVCHPPLFAVTDSHHPWAPAVRDRPLAWKTLWRVASFSTWTIASAVFAPHPWRALRVARSRTPQGAGAASAPHPASVSARACAGVPPPPLRLDQKASSPTHRSSKPLRDRRRSCADRRRRRQRLGKTTVALVAPCTDRKARKRTPFFPAALSRSYHQRCVINWCCRRSRASRERAHVVVASRFELAELRVVAAHTCAASVNMITARQSLWPRICTLSVQAAVSCSALCVTTHVFLFGLPMCTWQNLIYEVNYNLVNHVSSYQLN